MDHGGGLQGHRGGTAFKAASGIGFLNLPIWRKARRPPRIDAHFSRIGPIATVLGGIDAPANATPKTTTAYGVEIGFARDPFPIQADRKWVYVFTFTRFLRRTGILFVGKRATLVRRAATKLRPMRPPLADDFAFAPVCAKPIGAGWAEEQRLVGAPRRAPV